MLHPGTEHPFLVGHSACFGVRLGFAAWHAAQPSGLSDRAVLVAHTTCSCIEIAACYATRLPLPLLRQGCIIDRLLPDLGARSRLRRVLADGGDEVLAAFRKRRRKEGKPKQKQKQKQGGDNGGAAATAAEESAVLRSSDGAVDGGVVYTWPIYCRCLLSFFAFSLLLNESSIRRSEGAGGAGVEHLVER